MNLPDPLNPKTNNYTRILSDKGIKQAIDYGLLKINPELDPEDTKRIQPATLDVKINEVDEASPLDSLHSNQPIRHNTLSALSGYISTIKLTELIDFGQLSRSNRFLGVSSEARSSLRRLGIYMANWGAYFFSDQNNSYLEMGNFSPNNIHFEKEERIAQLFITVQPFKDYDIDSEKDMKQTGEMVRSMDMGVEVSNSEQLKLLQQKGFMEISNLETYHGMIKVHATDKAFLIKKVPEGIDFANRKMYRQEDLLEPIDISKGYTVKPFEAIVIETKENFNLSPHVGIRFWDNLFRLYTEGTNNKDPHITCAYDAMESIELCNLTDGWIDPGYKGGFSRQPKWIKKRTIHPGDVIGFGQVFYFPKAVGRAYGDSSLGSQYNKDEETKIIKG